MSARRATPVNTGDLDTIDIEPMESGHVARAVKLVLAVFEAAVAPGLSPEGIEEFKRVVNVKAMKARLGEGNVMVVAREGRRLVGVVEIRCENHVSLLFVAETHQRRGIARALFLRAVELCKTRHKHIETMTVNAALNATAAYRALGFKPTSPVVCVNGISHLPMAYTIPRHIGT